MLNKLNPHPFVEIHPEDAAALGIKAKDAVEIRSRRGRAVLPAVVTDRVRAGNCFAPMHWNDVFGEDLCINAVTNDAVDPISQQPEFKFCAVALSRVAPQATRRIPMRLTIPPRRNDVEPTAADHARPTQELDMSRIDALATLLGIPETPAPAAQRCRTHRTSPAS